MLRSPHQRTLVVLAVAVVMGLGSTTGTHATLLVSTTWPVGLLAGAAIWQRSRLHGYVVLNIGAVALVATFRIGGWSWTESIGISLAQILGAAATVCVLTSVGRRRALFVSEKDIAWYAVSALTGGLVAGTAIGVWYLVALDGDPVRAAFGLGAQHLASQLVLLPWFVSKRTYQGLAGRTEQVVQWSALAVVTTLVFSLGERPTLTFVVVVVLAWGARRLGTTETLAQLLLTVLIAGSLSYAGRGPFAAGGTFMGASADVPVLLMQWFTICCSLVVVPLVLTVSLQQQALRAASRERDRTKRIMASAESVVIIGGDLDTITYFSPGAERLLGFSADEMVGRRRRLMADAEVARLCDELGVDDFDGVCRALIAAEGAHELRLLRKDGAERVHLATLRSVKGDGHDEFVLVSEDITARIEEQQAQEATVERLREVDVAKDTFVSGVSHELRTPLTSIAGFLELLQEGAYGPLTDDQHEALGRIGSNSERLLGLVDDLLTCAHLGESDVGVQRAPMDLGDVVRTACHLVEPTWTARAITATVRVPAEPVMIEADRTMVERVVINLVGNAVKFTPERGRVDIEVRAQNGHAEIAVADTGIGIPADELDQLFSRFFRSRLARQRAVQGSGLGLSIAKSVVEAHDGADRGLLDRRGRDDGGGPAAGRRAPCGNIQDSTIVGPGDLNRTRGGGRDARSSPSPT